RPVRVCRNPKAYAGTPGDGPAGRTCGDCRHFVARRIRGRGYFKCGRVAWTPGPETDIRRRMPACERFEDGNG
ncbi:unnamed protein product, partial [Chrysoparadoxa australica]